MKYRLKIAQGSIPANMEFTNWEGYIEVFNEDNQTIIYYDNKDIPLLLKQGIIEEVQELKWTDEDMIEFVQKVSFLPDKYNTTNGTSFLIKELNDYEISKQKKERI